MISDALRIDIEKWASTKDQRALFAMAKSGRLTRPMVRTYIANVTYLIERTPGHLRRARERASALGDERLAGHYAHKLDEEEGHSVWGEADLESLSDVSTAGLGSSVTPAIAACASYLTKIIDEDPALYLTHLAFTEYVTVLLGPELLADIESRCGVPRSSMTVVDNHIELDREHAEEGFGIIDDLVGDPKKLAPMRRALAGLLEHFDRFCEEVTADRATAHEPAHVSAA